MILLFGIVLATCAIEHGIRRANAEREAERRRLLDELDDD